MVHTLSPARRSAALQIGVSLLVMTVAAGVAYGYLHPLLYGEGGALVTGSTAGVAAARDPRALLAIALWSVIVVTDVIVSLAVCKLYEPNHRPLARAAGAIRLAYSAILAAAVVALATVPSATDPVSRVALFEQIWSLGLIVFGAHLVALGLAALRGPETPRLLSWLIIGAGIAYSLIHALRNLGSETTAIADTIEPVLAAPMALAEIGLAVWLLVLFVRTSPSRIARRAAAA